MRLHEVVSGAARMSDRPAEDGDRDDADESEVAPPVRWHR